MRTAMAACVLGGLLLLVGAPAGFTVDGAEVRVHRAGGSAEVRIVYDLSVNNTACGWFQAGFDGLPEGALEPKAILVLDGKEFPATAEGSGGRRTFHAFRDAKEEGRRSLEGAKSVRLVLDFPAAPCKGPEVTVPLPLPRSYIHDGAADGTGDGLPRLSVRFDAEVEGASAEIKATFRKVPAGARLVLRSDPLGAGATVLP